MSTQGTEVERNCEGLASSKAAVSAAWYVFARPRIKQAKKEEGKNVEVLWKWMWSSGAISYVDSDTLVTGDARTILNTRERQRNMLIKAQA